MMLAEDKTHSVQGPAENSLISLDSGESITRILSGRGPSEVEKTEIARIKEDLKGLPKGRTVTPIVFPLDGPRPLASLLADDVRVRFDLAGDDRPATWPWVRPDTALLAWDSDRTGRITSGQQLFGSATWWIFWEHGYQPLALLDDDREAGSPAPSSPAWPSGATATSTASPTLVRSSRSTRPKRGASVSLSPLCSSYAKIGIDRQACPDGSDVAR